MRQSLVDSYDRLRDFEAMGMNFARDEDGSYARRPTRGLDLARVMYPDGGGLEFCWQLRRALEEDGVQLIDRLFITGLMRDDDGRITGAVGINSRTGEFHVIKARATIVAHQRHHVPLRLRARHHRHRHAARLSAPARRCAMPSSATCGRARRSSISRASPSPSRKARTGPTPRARRFMRAYEPDWADEADVPRIARAMAMEKRKGNAPLYLDMSAIPEHMRDYFMQSKVKWMDYFFRKLGSEAKTDMFGKTPYYALNQMTKMGIRTGPDCRSDVPGLLAAGLAQAGCANHFAGFHIGLCVGNGWIAGRSAIEDLDRAPRAAHRSGRGAALHAETARRSTHGRGRVRPRAARSAADHVRLRHRHPQARPTGWKQALRQVDRAGRASCQELAAPHMHELVRLKETEAMLLAAQFILGASLYRTESRLSHFREDIEERDDDNWLCWVDVTDRAATAQPSPRRRSRCPIAAPPRCRRAAPRACASKPPSAACKPASALTFSRTSYAIDCFLLQCNMRILRVLADPRNHRTIQNFPGRIET